MVRKTTIRATLKMALSCLCAFVLLGVLVACDSSSRLFLDDLRLLINPTYVSPYNWQNLTYEEERFVYREGGRRVSRTGIDVSSHQGSINWGAVAADSIEFAFIRLGHRGFTEGQIYLDEYFEDNYRGATEANIPVGVYFFSQALDEEEARAEARFVLEHLADRALNYPVVYDFEPVADAQGRANHLSEHQLTSNALAFCETIEGANYETMLYGNAGDISRYYLEILAGRDIWFAEYGATFPNGQFDFTIWQYSNSGQVAGIARNVDMNIEFIADRSQTAPVSS
jgi:GH25 family lysozyme M1 (1,4-beta-N-acetylmuramidase)